MNETTTKVIKLSNGEDIVCTCMESQNIDNNSDKLFIISPLKMEIRNKVTKKGVVEALTLSRWLQPFVQENNFKLEKSNIITMSDASYALNNYYNFMVDTYNEAEAQMESKDMTPSIQPRFTEDVAIEDQEQATEEVRKLFKQYISALTNDSKSEEEDLTEEELDSMPCSDTKH